MRRGPSFLSIDIDLSAAGIKRIDWEVTHITMTEAVDVTGAQALGALLDVSLGDVSADTIPMRINTIIQTRDAISPVILSWSAQPGVTATLMLSGDGIGVHAPPTTQLITSAVGTTLSNAQINAIVAGPTLLAAGGARQSVMIQNNGSADIYVGGPTVTTATGFRVQPGGILTIDKTTAGVYAIGAGTVDCRVLTEA